MLNLLHGELALLQRLTVARQALEKAQPALREVALFDRARPFAIDERFEERLDQFRSVLNADRAQRIRAMQAAGYFRADLDVEFINTCLTGMVYELVLRYVLPDEEPDLEWLIESFVEFALHGIAAPRYAGRSSEAGPSPEGE